MRIWIKTKAKTDFDQISLTTNYEDKDITKHLHSGTKKLRDLLQSYNEKEYLKTFCLNILFLPCYLSELHILLSSYRNNFEMIGITESRLKFEGHSEYWHNKL